MQYVFFEKGVCSVHCGLGQSSRSWGIFENFCVKSNLTVCKYTFNCKLQKKIGEAGCTSCSPNNYVEGATAPPVPAPMLMAMCRSRLMRLLYAADPVSTWWVSICGRVNHRSVSGPSRSTQPSTLHGKVKWVSAFGLINNNKWWWWILYTSCL